MRMAVADAGAGRRARPDRHARVLQRGLGRRTRSAPELPARRRRRRLARTSSTSRPRSASAPGSSTTCGRRCRSSRPTGDTFGDLIASTGWAGPCRRRTSTRSRRRWRRCSSTTQAAGARAGRGRRVRAGVHVVAACSRRSSSSAGTRAGPPTSAIASPSAARQRPREPPRRRPSACATISRSRATTCGRWCRRGGPTGAPDACAGWPGGADRPARLRVSAAADAQPDGATARSSETTGPDGTVAAARPGELGSRRAATTAAPATAAGVQPGDVGRRRRATRRPRASGSSTTRRISAAAASRSGSAQVPPAG